MEDYGYSNYIIKYGTRYIYLRTSKAYARTGEMWTWTAPRQVELEMLFNPWWVIIRMCCRLFDHEVHHYSLPLSSFDSSLFYGVPVVRVFVLLSPCLHWCWFVLFQTGLLACGVVEILYLYEIKSKSTTGRVCVCKQIVSLYVIDN